ncbi:MAG TPA: hypothetical protein V6D29_03600 [Leptolyngbyaceae cyanobacterium]
MAGGIAGSEFGVYRAVSVVIVTHEPDIAAQTKRVIRVQDGYVIHSSEQLTSTV